MLSRFAPALLIAVSCLAQDTARMDQIVESYATNNHFMGTVLVARGNQVLFSKGYGFADLEWNISNSPHTKFRLGSVTKQFTAACILLLEERGKLHVDDPVKKYMPDAPAAWDKITIFNLLTHTSGIPNFTSFPDYPKLEPFATTAAELVARFRDKPLDFQPGEKWSYSNSGYVLLSYLIEKISGESYEKFVQDNIFIPLHMNDSGFDSNSRVIANRASGYVYEHNDFQNAGFIHMSVPQGAGSLYSTTEDLLKWEQGLFGGKVLKTASVEKMTTPFKNDYAMGLAVETSGGHKVIEHGGGIEGFNTELEYYPDDKLTVVVLRNVNVQGGDPGGIAKQLAGLVHGDSVKLTSERKEITVDPAILTRYTGAYHFPFGDMLVFLENNQLTSRLGTQPQVPLFPESETMFFAKLVDAQIEFPKTNGQEKANQLTLHQGGHDMVAKRMDEADEKRLAASAEAAAKRSKTQTPAPGSEAALRKMVEDLRAGKPDYNTMSADLADATRQQLSGIQPFLTGLGAILSLHFKEVGKDGADVYEIQFEKGKLEWRIWLSADGKIESALFTKI